MRRLGHSEDSPTDERLTADRREAKKSVTASGKGAKLTNRRNQNGGASAKDALAVEKLTS
ncbi:MAG: hypothetical protein ACR2N0_17540 [Rubrobacteraceae bacterium]